jgi:ribosomal protein S19E (S16A)
MTANQWKLLKILDHHGGMGTIEVETQFGGYDYGDDEASEAKAFRVTRMVVAGLVRTLAKKGFATDDDNGYDITERGREILAKHTARLKAARNT